MLVTTVYFFCSVGQLQQKLQHLKQDQHLVVTGFVKKNLRATSEQRYKTSHMDPLAIARVYAGAELKVTQQTEGRIAVNSR